MPEVFIGVFLVVHVVDEPDDAPQFLVGAFLPGDMAHDGLDRQGVRNKVRAFYVIRKDRPCFFARGILGHNVSILSKRNRLCDIEEVEIEEQYLHNRTGEDNGDAHLKNLIMHHQVIVPITKGELDLGPWQSVFYAEFDGRRRKRVIVKVIGE